MRDKTYHAYLDSHERQLVIHSLVELSAPMIKCKKTANKKCRILAERRNT